MPRKKKDPEIVTDYYAKKLALEEQLIATNAQIAINRKAAYTAFGEFLIERNPVRAHEIMEKDAPPELRNLLASYGWNNFIQEMIEDFNKSKGQRKPSPEPPVAE